MNNCSHNEHIKFQHTGILIETHKEKLQRWTKVLGHFCISGAFSNSPNPLPSPHKQSWTRVSKIFPEFQICIGWGKGELQGNYEKDALFCESTQKVQIIMNTALSQWLLSRIVECITRIKENIPLNTINPCNMITWNQSMVQQFTSEGNFLSLLRKASPMGLMANTIWSWSRTRSTK